MASISFVNMITDILIDGYILNRIVYKRSGLMRLKHLIQNLVSQLKISLPIVFAALAALAPKRNVFREPVTVFLKFGVMWIHI